MGKNLHHQDSSISLDSHTPGCMSGILHHLHHNKWHNVKKMLPHKRHGNGKLPTDQESTRSTLEASEVQANADFVVEAKSPRRSSPKSSMKSRIKSLITEEMSKRKGRHRRSSSCPVRTQLEGSNSFQHLESSNPGSPVANNPNGIACQGCVQSITSLDPLIPKPCEEHSSNSSSCELCATMLTMNYLKQSELNKIGQGPVRNHTLLQDKLIYAIEPSEYALLQESKLYMDALDLLNMRQEVFLKIVQDPSSSLAHQLHCRRASNLRSGFSKSMSFPASSSSDQGYGKPEKDEIQHCIEETEAFYKHLATSRGSCAENHSLEQSELSDSVSSPTSANSMLRKRHDSKVALKRFKNLRETIKNVIRDTKKKNRIIMDGVLHKVPYGSQSRDDDQRNQESKDKFDQLGSDFIKSPLQRFKRTSSHNEQTDRYNRLLEVGSNNESNHCSHKLRTRTSDALSPIRSSHATLKRILSLPDLRSYSFFQIYDSRSTSTYHTPVRIASARKSSLSLGSEINFQSIGVSESGSQENLVDVEESFYYSADSKEWESASSHELSLEPVPGFAPHPSKTDDVSESDLNYQEDEFGQGDSETRVAIDTLESQFKDFYKNLQRVHVDAKTEAEFDYVKNILELSGFSRNEILGKWHSEDHPVDPSVFEEVEGCLVAEPECSGNEEGGSCDHLLLFDLINEVLLDIYEQSSCCWPMPLTCQSHVHRMPKGYHVLEEVWTEISWLLLWQPEIDQGIDDAVSRDLAKGNRWMNLQFDAECVGLEVEDLIFDDLLEEIICS